MFTGSLTPAVQSHKYEETIELVDEDTGELISSVVLNALTYTVKVRPYKDSDASGSTGTVTVSGDGYLTIILPASALDTAKDGDLRLTLDYSGDTGSGPTTGRFLDAFLPVVPQ